MTAFVSTGMRNYLAETGSVKAALNLGFIDIYSGTEPASADAAATGTKLLRVSVASSGTGTTLGSSSGGIIPKNSGEVWSGLVLSTGTSGYFRWVEAADDGTLSTTQKRLQGKCGTAGAEMLMTALGLTAGATHTIDAANIIFPAS